MAWLSTCIVLSRPPSLPTAPTPLGSISYPGSSSGFVLLQGKASTSLQPKWCMAILWLPRLNSSPRRLLLLTSVTFGRSLENLPPLGRPIALEGRPTCPRISYRPPMYSSEWIVIANLLLCHTPAHTRSSSDAQRHFSLTSRENLTELP